MGGRERGKAGKDAVVHSMLSRGFQVNGSTVGAGGQDVYDILSQEGGPVHVSGVEGKGRKAHKTGFCWQHGSATQGLGKFWVLRDMVTVGCAAGRQISWLA